MLVITIERADGRVECIERQDLGSAYATMPQLRERLIQANAAAARRDPAKGGRVLAIEWIELPKDAETLDWEAWLYTRIAEEIAYERRGDDPTGIGYQQWSAAVDARRAAERHYIAAHGLLGPHLAEERTRLLDESHARRRSALESAAYRGTD